MLEPGLKDVFAIARIFGNEQRPVPRVEQRRDQRIHFGNQIRAPDLSQGLFQLNRRERGQELLRGYFVVVSFVGPEELGEIRDAAVNRRIDLSFIRHNGFENALLLQAELRKLIVDDRIERDRALVQPIRKSLLFSREFKEPIRFDLEEGGCPHAIDDGRFSPNGGRHTKQYAQTTFQHNRHFSAGRLLLMYYDIHPTTAPPRSAAFRGAPRRY